jgi:hypothetical protein
MDALIGPNAIPGILAAGYNFDYIDDDAIARVGIPHRILILPGVERIPLAAYRKIEEYARQGGVVIAARRAPSLAPGLAETERDTPVIHEISRALFEGTQARGRMLADESKLGDALHAALAPDVASAPEIGFIHRHLPFAEVYFLANTSNHPVHAPAVFRVIGLEAAWWDPFTGAAIRAGGPRFDLDLAPYESRVVVFSKDRAAAPPSAKEPPPAPVEVSGPWSVTFAGSAQPVTMTALRSWTEDERTRYYSGEAVYETTVNVPPAMISSGRRIYLNFGEGTPVTTDERRSGSGMRAMLESPVREAALVLVNGKPAGTVWHPPYEVEVTALVRPGSNRIRAVVGNLAINVMAKGPLPDYRELNAKYGERFQPQDMANLQPLPSGLLAPVRVVAR